MNDKFYYKLLNIGSVDTDIEKILEDVVKDFIKVAKNGNKKLEGLCRVAATNIACELEDYKIDYRIINMYDYDLYDHELIIARTMNGRKLDYYLIDPTFIQFKGFYPFTKLEESNVYLLSNLVENGYSKIDNNDYNTYFRSFGYDGKELNMKRMFLEFNNKRKK